MWIKIINDSDNPTPHYATDGSAGMDIYANVEKKEVIVPGETMLIPTGLHIEMPQGYEVQIRPRSGLALKHGITVLNSPGTIDCDYRGEIGVIIINHGQYPYTISHGERIAQMVVSRYEKVDIEEAKSLEETERGEGGFGSTGK